jgi:hypothetical protein
MKFSRLIRHLFTSHWSTRRAFTKEVLQAIEVTVKTSERLHGGEIRFAIESSLDAHALWRDLSPRERALHVFSHTRAWDTAANNGVLIYVLHADRDVEIVADRGFNHKVAPAEWEEVCRRMETAFRGNDYRRGAVEGIDAVGVLIARHFPLTDANELPDKPILL